MYGDALRDPPKTDTGHWSAGIGGFLHGYWWFRDVPPEVATVVDMTKLEFTAIHGNFHTFDSCLPKKQSRQTERTTICIHCDGYAAALDMRKQRVKEPQMWFLHVAEQD